jgi:pSer/pThr/pTyr-binding forkhead associated (FHA) protein
MINKNRFNSLRRIKGILVLLALSTLFSWTAYALEIEIGILKDQEGRTRLELAKTYNFLGRSGRNDMILKNRFISRRHALISEYDGSYYIEDLFSKNKTYLNGRALSPGRRVKLKPGDIVKLTEDGAWFTFEIIKYDVSDADAQRLISLKSKKYTRVKLIMLDSKKQFSLEKDIISIGSAEVNDIVIPEAQVAPRQAIILLKDTPMVEDIRGRKGTKLNNEIVRYGYPKKLKSGDVITIADKVSFSIELFK